MKSFSAWLAKRFIKNYKETENEIIRAEYGILEGWISVWVNLILFIVKLFIGIILGSVSLIADAIHTLSDTATSAIVIVSFKISQKPADREHPYGHGRAEYIATLIISILLIVTGIEFFKSGIERILNPVMFTASWTMIGVIFITVFIKEGLGQISKNLGEMIDSSVLEADFWHHRTDAISSIFVIIAMIMTPLGYGWVDGAAALIVAGLLIYTGLDLAREAADTLLGSSPTPEYILKVRNTAKEVKDVLDAHDIVVHSYGQTRFIGMHVEIDSEIPPLQAHDITEEVELYIQKQLHAHCTVHYDPIQIHDERVNSFKTFLEILRDRHKSFVRFHDLRILDTGEYHYILFDMVTSDDPDSQAVKDLKLDIQTHILNKYPKFKVKIHITPLHKTQGVI